MAMIGATLPTIYKKPKKQGLSPHAQLISSSEVIDIIPIGAELFFEEPGKVADQNGKLIPVEHDYEKLRKITRYKYKDKEHNIIGGTPLLKIYALSHLYLRTCKWLV